MPRFDLARELARFDARAPIESARTPPASWYVAPEVLAREHETVFRNGWLYATPAARVATPGAMASLELGDEGYLVVRGDDGRLRAFHNACRHHATRLVEGEACGDEIVCPYHGWRYRLDGSLASAPRMAGVARIDRGEVALVPVAVEEWGPLVFVHPGEPGRSVADDLGELALRLGERATDALELVERRRYTLECNWKVFVDNYLDGGYHIEHLHHGLAGQLDMAAYRTELFERWNLQTCPSGTTDAFGEVDRIGPGALYAWVHPNLMLNRYGPALDTNLVLPLGPERCEVVFDLWYDPAARDRDDGFLERSLASTEATQLEDVDVCASVQRGLRSSSYDTGLYAPRVEHGMHHFHRLLAADLRG